jgi:phosphoribosyl-AMP cyclohydrolase
MATRAGSLFGRMLGREPPPEADMPTAAETSPALETPPAAPQATRNAVTETSIFAPRATPEQVEEGRLFAPKFDDNGLITCVVTDAWSAEVLMVAHMNAEALAKTIQTGEAWFYSRSRGKLWKKGETSGHVQRIVEMRVDCDQDALWLRVEQIGAGACHTGRASCFYRMVPLKQSDLRRLILDFRNGEKLFDPAEVYGEKTEKGEEPPQT